MKTLEDLILDKFLLEYVEKDWRLSFFVGCFFILAGTLGILAIPLTTLSTIRFFAFFMIIGGILQLSETFTAETDRKGRILYIIGGSLYIGAGLISFFNSTAAYFSLTFLFAVAIFASGMCRVALAFAHRRDMNDWETVLSSGLESVGIALLVVIFWPYSSLWLLGLFMSLDLVFYGWSHAVVAFEAGGNTKERKQAASAAGQGFAAV